MVTSQAPLSSCFPTLRLACAKMPQIWPYGRRCSQQSRHRSLPIFLHSNALNRTQPPLIPPGAPYPLPEAHATFAFPHIKVKTVIHHLQRLPLYKRSGCEILTHRVLRETASLLGPSITYLYNLSINTSSFPSDWKTAIVKPIFKHRGRAEDPTTYTPFLFSQQ